MNDFIEKRKQFLKKVCDLSQEDPREADRILGLTEDEVMKKFYHQYRQNPLDTIETLENEIYIATTCAGSNTSFPLTLNPRIAKCIIENPEIPIGRSVHVAIDGNTITSPEEANLVTQALNKLNLWEVRAYNFDSTEKLNTVVCKAGSPNFIRVHNSILKYFPDLSSNRSVKSIFFSDVSIETCNLNGVANPNTADTLGGIFFKKCDIATLNIYNMPKLKSLVFDQVKTSNPSLGGLKKLSHLTIENCNLEHLPACVNTNNLPGLRKLTINHNNISDLSSLKGLEGVKIEIKDNMLSSPSLADLEVIARNKCTLDIRDNSMTKQTARAILSLQQKMDRANLPQSIVFNMGNSRFTEDPWVRVLGLNSHPDHKDLISKIKSHPNTKIIQGFIMETSNVISNPYLKVALINMLKDIRTHPNQTTDAIKTMFQGAGSCETPARLALYTHCLHMHLREGRDLPEDIKNNISLHSYVSKIFEKHSTDVKLPGSKVSKKIKLAYTAEAIEGAQGMVYSLLTDHTAPIESNNRPRLIVGRPFVQKNSNPEYVERGLHKATSNILGPALDEFYLSTCKSDEQGRLKITPRGNAIADKTKIERILENEYLHISNEYNDSKGLGTTKAEQAYRNVYLTPGIWANENAEPLSHITTDEHNNHQRLVSKYISLYEEGKEGEFAEVIKKAYLVEQLAINADPTQQEMRAIEREEMAIPDQIKQWVKTSNSRLKTTTIQTPKTKMSFEQAELDRQHDVTEPRKPRPNQDGKQTDASCQQR